MATDVSLLPEEAAREILTLNEQLAVIEAREEAQAHFLSFIKSVYPNFIEGKHHRIFAEKLEGIRDGTIKRLIVNMPPRHSKSEFASYLFPAWILGHKPDLKIIQATHTGELATRFGRKMKNLIDSNDYRQVFPETRLRADSQAAGRWETDAGGEYFAAGVGGAITGRGADLLIIDDPHSEQDALSETAFDNTWEWYTSGPSQRLQPGGIIVLVMTRWSTKDLTGQVLKAQAADPHADKWEVVEFPAILPSGKPLWPEFWKLQELEGVKASLAPQKWNAQWLQQPTASESAIFKREWWKIWEDPDRMPNIEYILQSYDTAFSSKQTADFSAITTWGVFRPNGEFGPQALILLDSIKGRWDFPELKRVAFEQYNYWEPEMVIVEAKASGMPLTFEMRQMGIPVTNFTPSRGNDKVTRAHACAPLLESGQIWAPDTRWAEELIEECAAFPNGDNDDLVDSTTQAILRFRQGGFVSDPTDYYEDTVRERRSYY